MKKPKPESHRWFTEAEDRVLLSHGSSAAIARRLGRSVSSCRSRLELLSRMAQGRVSTYRKFTAKEDDLIRSKKFSVTELADRFGRPRSAVSVRYKRLGAVSENPRKRAFSPADDEILLAHREKSHSEIARMLGRDRSSVRKRRSMLAERPQHRT